jgi:hypothetical protein
MRLLTDQTFLGGIRGVGGGVQVEDDERGGRPKSTQTEVNITAVADLVGNAPGAASVV